MSGEHGLPWLNFACALLHIRSEFVPSNLIHAAEQLSAAPCRPSTPIAQFAKIATEHHPGEWPRSFRSKIQLEAQTDICSLIFTWTRYSIPNARDYPRHLNIDARDDLLVCEICRFPAWMCRYIREHRTAVSRIPTRIDKVFRSSTSQRSHF